MADQIRIYDEQSITPFTKQRDGETRVWQQLALLDNDRHYQDALKDAHAFGIRYVIVGICEDIGPRANCGQGGASEGFYAFLQRFLNLPVNEHTPTRNVLLLGEVECQDLQKQSEKHDNTSAQGLAQLRELCAEIDERVTPVITAILAANLIPIVIGGGHNNCYPLLKAAQAHFNTPINAVNLDPHADFRALEGRHSGNGFHYAASENALNRYHVFALDEQKNNQAILTALAQHGATYSSYHSLFVAKPSAFSEHVLNTLKAHFDHSPLAIELDVDAISLAPASAFNYRGVSLCEAEQYVYHSTLQRPVAYLHLCEAAPAQSIGGKEHGMAASGQLLSALVVSFLKARAEQS